MKYCIISDCDRPSEHLICQVMDNKGFYINKKLRHDHGGMSLDSATDIKDFGFEYTESNGFVVFAKTKESVAKYKNGKHRNWQGSNDTVIKYLVTNVEDILTEYIKAVNKIDDLFEHKYRQLEKEEIKIEVLSFLDQLTKRLKVI